MNTIFLNPLTQTQVSSAATPQASCRRAHKISETIMKPLKLAGRLSGWLLAAGLAMTSLTAMPANAQDQLPTKNTGGPIKLDKSDPHPDDDEVTPFFVKTGAQISCEAVRYTLVFGAKGHPAAFDEAFIEHLKGFPIDIKDRLPGGLSIESVTVSGDVTGPGGGAVPDAVISTFASPDDTMELNDLRLSGVDLDGDGDPGRRFFTINIFARIDHAVFGAPTLVANQAEATLGGAEVVFSHDPALPDDLNFLTGEPTKISIDVSDCDDPPDDGGDPGGGPGGEEACFKVETGEVDCHPGGGVFTYRMTVGAELSGNVIELVSKTPGIWIDPPWQVVPEGGGVLEWDIHGAGPGEIVHLVAIGIESHEGPAEGVGLCCTQEIEIIIPEDIDCPPPVDKKPDIKVEKRADTDECTVEGGCDFTIRVTNVGTAPYNGKIVLDEVTVPGNATVTSGPNAPWTCVPGISPLVCEHPATTLNPGAFVELKLGFTPGATWGWPFIKNCAEYDYTASGFDHVFGDVTNDKACASIPICLPNDPECDPGDDPKIDLIIRKRAESGYCTPDGVCRFVIDILNNTTTAYNGPLSVRDEFVVGVPGSVSFQPVPPWVCGPDGAPNKFKCDHPGIVIPAMGSTSLTVEAINDDWDTQIVENCATLVPHPDDINPGNNGPSCDRIKIPTDQSGSPDIKIEKVCSPGVAGGVISCRISVRNDGDGVQAGTISVSDGATLIGGGGAVPIQSVTPDGPEWSCGPVPAPTLACQIDGAHVPPGSTRFFDVTLSLSGIDDRFENCAEAYVSGGDGDAHSVGEACARGGVDITMEKVGDSVCTPGEPCNFTITIRNNGESDYSGPMVIADALVIDGVDELVSAPISIAPPLGCAPEPTALPFVCEANISLAAGASQAHVITVTIPETAIPDGSNYPNGFDGTNCAMAVHPDAIASRAIVPGELTLKQGTAGGPTGQASQTEGRFYMCHPFAVPPVVDEPQCSAGLVLNDAGRCVCPEGQAFRNGRCVGLEPPLVPVPTPPPSRADPDPKPELCKLKPGQFRGKDGKCYCPRGQKLGSNGCYKPQPPKAEQCKLLPGQFRGKDGKCYCPRGQRIIGGRCRAPRPDCPPNTGLIKNSRGQCVCPRGEKLIRGVCRRPEPPQCRLLPGQFRGKDGKCYCPRGQRVIGGRCRAPRPDCPPNTGLIKNNRGQCVCPRGQRFIRGVCRRPEAPQCRLLPGQFRGKDGKCYCPRGQRVINGRCQSVSRPEICTGGRILYQGKCVCPRGQKLVRGVCRKPERAQCRLLPGQFRGKDGKCYCPRGQRVIKGRCQRVSRPEVCTGGRVLYKGKCVCRRGTRWNGKQCARIVIDAPRRPDVRRQRVPDKKLQRVQPRCPKGQIYVPGARRCLTPLQ